MLKLYTSCIHVNKGCADVATKTNYEITYVQILFGETQMQQMAV